MIETDSSLLKPNVNGQSFTSPYEPKVSRYQTMLKVMDEEIGNIMKTAPNNTYFIFMSDNGGLESVVPSNDPLRGSKKTAFNGGINSPLIISYNGINGGQKNQSLVNIMDLSATLTDIFDGQATMNYKTKLFEGSTLLPIFLENSLVSHDYYVKSTYSKGSNAAFVRNWKYVKHSNVEYLFDWRKDWFEQNDLSNKMPDTLNLLRNDYLYWDSLNNI